MKRLQVIGLFVATFLFGAAKAQTADEIINKHIAAIGGKEAWSKVNSMKMEAGLSVQGMDIPVIIYQVHNKGQRQEYTVMNMTGYTIISTEGGWNFSPMEGHTKPEPMTADALKAGQDGLDIHGDLLDYASKGHKVELQGKEDVDGTEAFKIKVVRKSGNEVVYFIDPSTYYIIRAVNKMKVNGQEIEQKINMSNYQKLPEGIVVPFSMEMPGAPAPVAIKKVEVNPTLDPALFKPAQ
ncbi:MAG: outer membrane lipoprotein-sorting protein [Sphingobacteriales bacterium]|nr:MAG: outer membrane lipoprotein-sorting protein [Sphingobacteriales bacterium]